MNLNMSSKNYYSTKESIFFSHMSRQVFLIKYSKTVTHSMKKKSGPDKDTLFPACTFDRINLCTEVLIRDEYFRDLCFMKGSIVQGSVILVHLES
jgi:hypothetical protein